MAACALVTASGAHSAEPEIKPVALSPYVYVPGPASYVAGPHVISARFSQSGRYVLLSMTTPEGARKQKAGAAAQTNHYVPAPGFVPLSVVVWNRRTHRASVTWTAPWEEATLQAACWLPGSDTALVSVVGKEPFTLDDGTATKRLEHHVLQMDPRRGTVVERSKVQYLPSTYIEVSPRLPIALLAEGGESISSVRVLRQSGISEPIPLPMDTSHVGKWSADGATLYLPVYGPGSDMERRKPSSWVAVDTRHETATSIAGPPANSVARVAETPFALPFGFIESEVNVKDGARTFSARPLWLDCGGKDVYLLHPDAGSPEGSRQSDAVVYLSDGFAFLRGLERKSRPAQPQPPTPGGKNG